MVTVVNRAELRVFRQHRHKSAFNRDLIAAKTRDVLVIHEPGLAEDGVFVNIGGGEEFLFGIGEDLVFDESGAAESPDRGHDAVDEIGLKEVLGVEETEHGATEHVEEFGGFAGEDGTVRAEAVLEGVHG